MNVDKYFTIPWKGLEIGTHHFDFEADNTLFEAFESPDIKTGKVAVSIELERAPSALLLDVEMEGEVVVECDRCLDDLALPVDFQGELQVKFSDEVEDYDGDVLWMNPADGELKLAQYIYESIFLCLPYSRVHGEDEDGKSLCNPEMLAKFSIISDEEFERMAEEIGTELAESPGADKLQALKEQLEKEQNK